MVDTYSRAPFISHDGEDENGVRAEVKVVTGYGRVNAVEASNAGKSFKVSFAVENTKYFPSGWAPDGSNVLAKIRKAEEDGTPIHFRIETRRQKHVDRSLPMDQVVPKGDTAAARDNIHKSLAAVKFEGEDEWTVSVHAVTHMSEDPKDSGNGLYAATGNEAKKGGASGGNKSYAGIEPAPYVNKLKDGSVNPGSIAASVPINLLSFVAEWDRDHADDPTAQVGEKRRATVAKVLLMAANELQLKIWDGQLDVPDLGAGSHTRARGLLFEVIRAYYPISSEVVDSKESLLAWKDQLVEKSLGIWRWSINEVDHIINR